MKTRLETEYQARSVRLDDRRFYSTSSTTRVQEIEAYGKPGEYYAAECEGNGFILKVSSITRIQQCERGVYIGIEATALSREIPPALRFAVDHIGSPGVSNFVAYFASADCGSRAWQLHGRQEADRRCRK